MKKHLDVHVVLDNSSTHKTAEVNAWLDTDPRFKLHSAPTSASWINLVDRFFAEITRKGKPAKRVRSVAVTEMSDTHATSLHELPEHGNPPSGTER